MLLFHYVSHQMSQSFFPVNVSYPLKERVIQLSMAFRTAQFFPTQRISKTIILYLDFLFYLHKISDTLMDHLGLLSFSRDVNQAHFYKSDYFSFAFFVTIEMMMPLILYIRNSSFHFTSQVIPKIYAS